MTDASSRRIGIVVMQGRPIDELRRDWKLIEDAGFHSLWLIDHVMSYPVIGVMLEAWTTLAAMAMATERIRIGALVTNITYRNPALVAKEAITLDHLSGGRLELGIGAAGTRSEDNLVSGTPVWTTKERIDRFEEFVELIDVVTSGRADTFDGAYYRTQGFARGPWPVQRPRPPITIAAHGPRTLRIAARFADTWNAVAGFGRRVPELRTFLPDANARLDEYARQAGRKPSDIRRSLLVSAAGTDWWSSDDALAGFLGEMEGLGMQDFVFYYPPYGETRDKIAPDALIERLSRAFTRL